MLGHLGAILGPFWGIFGHLERFWAIVGPFLEQSWPIWDYFGTLFGPTLAYLELVEAILDHLGGILGTRAFKIAPSSCSREWPPPYRAILGPI